MKSQMTNHQLAVVLAGSGMPDSSLKICSAVR